jgi:hypothetical protein
MRERLNELNGYLEIESDGQGTVLRAVVPLFDVSPTNTPGNGRVHRQTSADVSSSQGAVSFE